MSEWRHVSRTGIQAYLKEVDAGGRVLLDRGGMRLLRHGLLHLRLLALLAGRVRRVQDVRREVLRGQGVPGHGDRDALAVHHVNLDEWKLNKI